MWSRRNVVFSRGESLSPMYLVLPHADEVGACLETVSITFRASLSCTFGFGTASL